jgi:hypothetical protein
VDASKICRAATYMGLGNEKDPFGFKIKVKAMNDFKAKAGQ